jgi:hypothetical protein
VPPQLIFTDINKKSNNWHKDDVQSNISQEQGAGNKTSSRLKLS